MTFPHGSYGGGTYGITPTPTSDAAEDSAEAHGQPGPPDLSAARVVPPPGEFGRIYGTLRAIIDSYVSYFEKVDVRLPVDNDGRVVAFVSDGSVGYDRPLLAVEFIRFRMGSPGNPTNFPIQGNSEYTIEATVHLTRDVPVADTRGLPSPGEREAASTQLLQDAWTLAEGAIYLTAQAMAGGPEYLVGAPYRRVLIQDIVPYGPHGGVGGNVATLHVDVQ